MKILVTGSAGFIGFHVARALLEEGNEVIGLDNLNKYYDVNLKLARNKILKKYPNYTFYKIDLQDRKRIDALFTKNKIQKVCHLGAQAGVRYSLINPYCYIDSNIVGFLNIVEASRRNKIKHFVFASSSSVYGANTKMPYSVHQNVDHPLSLYAATKKSNELIAHTYAHLYKLPCTGLRFFTVYGPWGRPDMALFIFTKAITKGKTINVFNYGKMQRDFTYIDDIVEGVVRVLKKIPKPDLKWDSTRPDAGASYAPYKIYNIGNHNPVNLMDVITLLEENIGKKAKIHFEPMQPGDVPSTYADIDDLIEDVNFVPKTSFEEGTKRFIQWYKDFYL